MKATLYTLTLLAVASLACGVSATDPAFVEYTEPAPAVVAYAYPTETPFALPTPSLLAVTADVLTVRSCAATACPALGYANKGDLLTALGGNVLTGGNDCQQWVEVEYNAAPAWVCAEYVERR